MNYWPTFNPSYKKQHACQSGQEVWINNGSTVIQLVERLFKTPFFSSKQLKRIIRLDKNFMISVSSKPN